MQTEDDAYLLSISWFMIRSATCKQNYRILKTQNGSYKQEININSITAVKL